MASLILDHREKQLIDCFTTSPPETEVMPLGDAKIIKDKDGEILLIFERKSIRDMISSIFDGRYKNQSFRLEHSGYRIVYIIEGTMSFLEEKQRNMVQSAITNMILNKGFNVIRTDSPSQTVQMLLNFLKRVNLKPKYVPTSYAGTVCCPIKKENITRDNIGPLMLSAIPGISSVFAEGIMETFKSIETLVAALRTNTHCLDNILVNNRKLPTTVIQSIHDLLL